MIDLFFYTTLGCHLCEQAEVLILQSLDQTQYSFNKIDILEHTDEQGEQQSEDALFEQYGIRIPVLKRSDNQQELNWPFDENHLQLFLE